ncbi:expressed unknown protein [Seminavis robusta]|uniref:Uncharacterized protein n=1 Tax=Seminavis robusta TaxID=568900 RepID=A0A9N8EVY2_9STRA|nr:expressed unknown protein [Seminavis robusta]|eukprot:Sro1765_g296140.2  (631) ;mRNA; r:2700-4592
MPQLSAHPSRDGGKAFENEQPRSNQSTQAFPEARGNHPQPALDILVRGTTNVTTNSPRSTHGQRVNRVSAWTVAGLLVLLWGVLNNANHVDRYRRKIQQIIQEPVAIVAMNNESNNVRVVEPLSGPHHEQKSAAVQGKEHGRRFRRNETHKNKTSDENKVLLNEYISKDDSTLQRKLPSVMEPPRNAANAEQEPIGAIEISAPEPTNVVPPSTMIETSSKRANPQRVKAVQRESSGEKNSVSDEDSAPALSEDDGRIPEHPDEKCSPWAISLDEWWQDHPDWDVSTENDTHTCFRPIADPLRASFLRQVHALQFDNNTSTCGKAAIRKVQDMGFAALMLFHINNAFWSAFRQGRRFQVALPYQGFRWLYVPTSKSSWAHCPTQNQECYFLPISNCPEPLEGDRDDKPKKKHIFHEVFHNDTLAEQNMWLSHYTMRPRQVLRHRLYQFLQSSNVPVAPTPCVWLHVRRGDSMTERNYIRNYYRLEEYLRRGKVSPTDNILLLTDDQTTLEEARVLHSNYHFHYWNRTRVRGPVENNAHIPSGDPSLEVLYILAERKLASRCQKGVHGNSNMATLFRNAMALEHGGLGNLTMMAIDGPLKKTRVEPEEFVRMLDTTLLKAQNKTVRTPTSSR